MQTPIVPKHCGIFLVLKLTHKVYTQQFSITYCITYLVWYTIHSWIVPLETMHIPMTVFQHLRCFDVLYLNRCGQKSCEKKPVFIRLIARVLILKKIKVFEIECDEIFCITTVHCLELRTNCNWKKILLTS